jgi:hypothetical protein
MNYSCCEIVLWVKTFLHTNGSGGKCWLGVSHWPGCEWANTWHWTKHFTVPLVNHWDKCANENQDEHPLPIIMAVMVVFFLNDNWIISNGSFCSHCLCYFVSEQLIPSDKWPQKAITSAFIQMWKFRYDKHILLIIGLLHCLDSKTQFFTLRIS